MDLMMATLEVASLVLTMDTLEEVVVNPVLMTGLAKEVANLAATPKDTKVLVLMMDQRAAAKDPVNPALMVDTLVVASPVLTMVTQGEENLVPMMDTLEEA